MSRCRGISTADGLALNSGLSPHGRPQSCGADSFGGLDDELALEKGCDSGSPRQSRLELQAARAQKAEARHLCRRGQHGINRRDEAVDAGA